MSVSELSDALLSCTRRVLPVHSLWNDVGMDDVIDEVPRYVRDISDQIKVLEQILR